MKIQMIRGYKLQQNVQISNSDMWAADTLFLSKENPFFNKEVSSQSAEK